MSDCNHSSFEPTKQQRYSFHLYGGDDLFDAGLRAARRGWLIFPCNGRKQPLTAHGCKDGTTDEQQIRTWATSFPGALWGRAIPKEIVVIDLDMKHGKNGFKEFERLQSCKPEDFAAPRVATATGGMHIYTDAGDKEFKNTVDRIAHGIDTRTLGGYVIIPGGPQAGYHWLSDPDTPLPVTPSWADVALQQKSEPGIAAETKEYQGCSSLGNAILKGACQAIATARAEQEMTLNRKSYVVGRYVGGGLIEYDVAINALVKAAAQMENLDPSWPWEFDLVYDKVERALNNGMSKPQDGEESYRLMQEAMARFDTDREYQASVEECLLMAHKETRP